MIVESQIQIISGRVRTKLSSQISNAFRTINTHKKRILAVGILEINKPK